LRGVAVVFFAPLDFCAPVDFWASAAFCAPGGFGVALAGGFAVALAGGFAVALAGGFAVALAGGFAVDFGATGSPTPCFGCTGFAPGFGASERLSTAGVSGAVGVSWRRRKSPDFVSGCTGLNPLPAAAAPLAEGLLGSDLMGRKRARTLLGVGVAFAGVAFAAFIGMLPALAGGGYLCSTQYC